MTLTEEKDKEEGFSSQSCSLPTPQAMQRTNSGSDASPMTPPSLANSHPATPQPPSSVLEKLWAVTASSGGKIITLCVLTFTIVPFVFSYLQGKESNIMSRNALRLSEWTAMKDFRNDCENHNVSPTSLLLFHPPSLLPSS